MAGVNRFLERFYALKDKTSDTANSSSDAEMVFHQTIKKVGEDIEQFKFNTAISQMMILLNTLEKEEKVALSVYKVFIQLLAPFAPHLAEELWSETENGSVHTSAWPSYDSAKLTSDTVTIALQIGGKLRGTFTVQRELSDEEVLAIARAQSGYEKYVGEMIPKKTIIIKDKIVNVVI